jgi:hypothetical protein
MKTFYDGGMPISKLNEAFKFSYCQQNYSLYICACLGEIVLLSSKLAGRIEALPKYGFTSYFNGMVEDAEAQMFKDILCGAPLLVCLFHIFLSIRSSDFQFQKAWT